MTITGLDSIDRELIALLQMDDRVSVAEMGKRLGIPPSTLNDRIRRLVRNGTITGFHAHVSPEMLGLDLLAFVFVGWSDPKTEQEFLRRIADAPQVLECHTLMGDVDFLLKIIVGSIEEYEQFFWQKLSKIDGVQGISSSISMSQPVNTTRLPLRATSVKK